MYKGILHTHYFVVILFLLIYVVKTVLLLGNKNDILVAFAKKVRFPEMIVSFVFIGTGVYLMTQLPFGGKFDYLFWIKIGMVFTSIPIAVIGFKKFNKVLAALSLLLIVSSFGLAEVYHKKKGIAKDTTVSVNGEEHASNGKSLYDMNCSLCHGADGKLGLAGAKDLSVSTMDVAEVKKIILEGRNMMAPVNVNEVQAQTIAEYVVNNLEGQ